MWAASTLQAELPEEEQCLCHGAMLVGVGTSGCRLGGLHICFLKTGKELPWKGLSHCLDTLLRALR